MRAIEICCDLSITNRIVAVTGQAGTGKTTILRHVYRIIEQAGYDVVLCAVTGKAAKRIKEATGIPACTIHRLLEYSHPGELDPETGKPQEISGPSRTPKNPLREDVVLVDESAMIPRDLYRNLIDALKPGSFIRFFGDVNQLQPIEEIVRAGEKSSFQGLLINPVVKSVTLKEIFRQADGSSITFNGDRIIRGMQPIAKPDFAIKVVNVPIAKLGDVVRALKEEGKVTFESNNYQIITPARRNKVGSLILNRLLVDIYSDRQADGIYIPRHTHETKITEQKSLLIRVGDKVIVNSNMYDLRPRMDERYHGKEYIPAQPHQMVFNGESGIVVDVANECLTIDVGDRVVTIPDVIEYKTKAGLISTLDPRKDVEHAYAITTHKAQGSEYEGVLYFVSRSAGFNQCRANYYTGISRAKKQICVIGDSMSLGNYSLRREPPVWKK